MRDRYWHNMAARIQRAWRSYIRHKNECASRIQRFWKNKKEGIVYVNLRDYGHQVLASRKERRRFSLLSMRQFRGDYLGVQSKDPQGDLLRNVCGISRGWIVKVLYLRPILIDPTWILLQPPNMSHSARPPAC
jgi:myosin I